MIGKKEEVHPSTTADIEKLERKLDICKQTGGGNQKERNLENSDACHILSNALYVKRQHPSLHIVSNGGKPIIS